MTELTTTDVADLGVFPNPCDLRRDLHTFIDYVQEREVKRLVRTNDLSKADSRRLAKLVSDPQAEDEVEETGTSYWVDYVDGLALKLGFVSYDTKGEYAGYTSRSPSFHDNYIQFNAENYQQFLDASLAEQERRLLRVLLDVEDGGASELYRTGILGRLRGFPSWGSATGVVPTLDFPQVRRFLLNLLPQECEVGTWYSTPSLVQYLKANHRFFLIPEKPKYKSKWDREKGRYGNFHESERAWGREIDIPEDAPDAFERVEGRYVERFLESIPHVLDYVEVAYDSEPYEGVYPPINHLKAFRITSRLPQVVQGDVPEPKVTVQPNFEVYVESQFYSANVLNCLTPLAELISEDILTVLKLQKEKVAAQLAKDENLDVVALLTRLSAQEVPRNVIRELREWTVHSEKFTLYQDFALLEGDEDLPAADPFTVERIAPNLRIVRSPEALFTRLEEAALVPLRIKHAGSALHPLPEGARTVFPKKTEVVKPKPKPKEPMLLRRETTIRFHFPNSKSLNQFRKALLDRRCPAEVDKDNLTLTFSKRYQSEVEKVIKALAEDYVIRIEDVE
ncbi:MAG: hypothetical protein MAG451_03239 [Anaerolineales bacterium]|nr:hypothetical protein [Anaerolineales bacterium]